jgi:hypothetical protein
VVIRICKSKKDRQHNSQKDKQRSTKHIDKTKDPVTPTGLKTEGELRCSERVSSSCSTCGTHRVTLIIIPVISREWGKERIVIATMRFVRSEYLSTCCSIFSFLCNVLKIVLSFCPFSFGYCVVVCSPSIYHF